MALPAIDCTLGMDVEQPFHIVSCRIEEGLSELTHAELEIASTENLDLSRVLTGGTSLTMLSGGVPTRTWTLKVGSIGFSRAQADSLRFAVHLYAHPWLLRFTENTRKFRKMSAKEIISQVLGECGVPFSWQLTREPKKRNYCVQYHESNLDFVRRLLEFEGIYYSFDDDGVMVMGDQSSAAPPVPGASSFELVEAEAALAHGQVGIIEFRRGSAVASGMATVNDYNWKTPDQNLLCTKSAARNPYLEIYDYPAGYRVKGDGERLAQLRLEALQVPARYVAGRSTVPGFAACRTFGFGGAAGGAFAGEYLLTHVEHEYRNPAYEKGGAEVSTIYQNEFRAIDRGVPFRPAVSTPRPTIAGYHTAMVRGPAGEEIHTDAMARFKAQFHWDREATGTDADSRWVRMVQESASSTFLARVGWEMNVGYIAGDPDRPIGLARNINGVMVPAYGQPANKNTMTIKTPSSPATGGFTEVKLVDTAGSQNFYVKAERDQLNTVKNDRSERIGNNETRHVVSTLKESVERDQSIEIGADSTTKTSASSHQTTKRNRTDTIGGNETVEVGSADHASVGGDDAVSVGSVRLSIVGSIKPPDIKGQLEGMVPDPKAALQGAAQGATDGAAAGAQSGGVGGAMAGAQSGAQGGLASMVPAAPSAPDMSMNGLIDQLCTGQISRSGNKQMTRMVGGAYINAALGNISTQANYGLAELVGGVKLSVAAQGGIGQSVMGPLFTTVGGVIMRKAKDDMSYSSPKATVTVGGVGKLATDEKLEIKSDGTIEVTALGSLKVATEKLSFELAPDGLTMEGDMAITADDKIAITGGKDDVTA